MIQGTRAKGGQAPVKSGSVRYLYPESPDDSNQDVYEVLPIILFGAEHIWPKKESLPKEFAQVILQLLGGKTRLLGKSQQFMKGKSLKL